MEQELEQEREKVDMASAPCQLATSFQLVASSDMMEMDNAE